MDDLSPDSEEDMVAERPLECSECKRTIAVRYTEIVGGNVTHTSMCAQCPQLERRLHGIPAGSLADAQGETGLVCGDCGTTLANVRMGSLLGCSHCYEVFGDVILMELQAMNRIPTQLTNHKKSTVAHVGRAPGKLIEISPTSRLADLNEALTETLTREDYEQAALLRDQIKKLTENPASEKSDEGQ